MNFSIFHLELIFASFTTQSIFSGLKIGKKGVKESITDQIVLLHAYCKCTDIDFNNGKHRKYVYNMYYQ